MMWMSIASGVVSRFRCVEGPSTVQHTCVCSPPLMLLLLRSHLLKEQGACQLSVVVFLSGPCACSNSRTAWTT